jgi:hypothetical protein
LKIGTYDEVIIDGSFTVTGFKAWSRKQGPGDTSPGPIFRNGQIRDFSGNGVLVDSTGFIDLGSGPDSLAGINEIHSDATSTPKYIETVTPRKAGLAAIQAQYNWYGEYPPDSTRFGPDVVYLPALTEAPSKPGTTPLDQAPRISELRVVFQAFPNPFSAGVDFVLGGIPSEEEVTIEVFDVAGRAIRKLRGLGTSRIAWDGRDAAGHEVVNGLYWARVIHNGRGRTEKLVKVQ